MTYEWYDTPTLEEVKAQIENTYKLKMHARTIDGTHMLTQYSPLYVDISWSARTYNGNNDLYHVTVAKNDHSIPIYGTGYRGLRSVDEVIRQLSPFCKRRTFEQPNLFETL